MEPILLLCIILLVLCIVVVPAVWSKHPERRTAALEVLRMILTAFGRRAV